MTRKHVARTAIVCTALGMAIGAAHAQNAPGAWRCGNSYGDQPCQGGKAVAIGDAPSAEQVREAERNTHRTRAAADRMERDRLRQEKAASAPPIHLPRATTAVAPAEVPRTTTTKKKNRKEPDFFTAAGPGSKKKKSQIADAGG